MSQILAFQHPSAGKQLVKGTLEAGEELGPAVLRELLEESGLNLSAASLIGELEHLHLSRSGQPEKNQQQLWYLFVLDAPANCPESWQHEATGSADEEGLIFEFFWQDLASSFEGYAAVFGRVMEVVKDWKLKSASDSENI